MTSLPFWTVDAFTSNTFGTAQSTCSTLPFHILAFFSTFIKNAGGNPAGVCLLKDVLTDKVLLQVAKNKKLWLDTSLVVKPVSIFIL